jgi:hypothetical protein
MTAVLLPRSSSLLSLPPQVAYYHGRIVLYLRLAHALISLDVASSSTYFTLFIFALEVSFMICIVIGWVLLLLGCWDRLLIVSRFLVSIFQSNVLNQKEYF